MDSDAIFMICLCVCICIGLIGKSASNIAESLSKRARNTTQYNTDMTYVRKHLDDVEIKLEEVQKSIDKLDVSRK